jgi:hypothetical protein
MRRHLYLMALANSPIYKRCGKEEEFCASVKPWFYSDLHIWDPFSWTQKKLSLSLGAVWD